MKKTLIIATILILIFILCGSVLLWFVSQPSTAQVSSSLTPTSHSRIEKMRAAGEISTSLRQNENESGEVFTTPCFEVTVPLPFSSARDQIEPNICLLRAQITHPRGVLVVHSQNQPNISSLPEASGVKLRMDSTEYEEIEIKNKYPYNIAFKSKTELTVFIYQAPTITTVSFSEFGQVDETLIEAAEKAVGSLELFGLE